MMLDLAKHHHSAINYSIRVLPPSTDDLETSWLCLGPLGFLLSFSVFSPGSSPQFPPIAHLTCGILPLARRSLGQQYALRRLVGAALSVTLDLDVARLLGS
jgi:hypothetical protein